MTGWLLAMFVPIEDQQIGADPIRIRTCCRRATDGGAQSAVLGAWQMRALVST